jgi:hypothetical protein
MTQPRTRVDPFAEDLDSISTRSLALTRYKRNHDLMNEVFRQAAFGTSIPDAHRTPPGRLTTPSPLQATRTAPHPLLRTPSSTKKILKAELYVMNLILLPILLLEFCPIPQAKLEQEIELMKQKAAERRVKKLQGAPDVAMQDQGQLLTA